MPFLDSSIQFFPLISTAAFLRQSLGQILLSFVPDLLIGSNTGGVS